MSFRLHSDKPNLLSPASMALWSMESNACFQSRNNKHRGGDVWPDHSVCHLNVHHVLLLNWTATLPQRLCVWCLAGRWACSLPDLCPRLFPYEQKPLELPSTLRGPSHTTLGCRRVRRGNLQLVGALDELRGVWVQSRVLIVSGTSLQCHAGQACSACCNRVDIQRC